MHVINILKFLDEKPRLKSYITEELECQLNQINELIQIEETRTTADYTRSKIKTGFISYELKGNDFYLKITTDKDYKNFYLNNLYVKDGFF